MELRGKGSGEIVVVFFFLLFLSVFVVVAAIGHHIDDPLDVRNPTARRITNTNFQDRRRLTGPGSYPPRCKSKCGKCTPCRPVHVPVPPGTPVTTEYYPEAWRCKCGTRLYLP